MINIYDKNGWLNIPEIANAPQFIKCLIGGRGIGKTYGVLDYSYHKREKFIYMRMTQTESDLVLQDDFNPFKSLNNDKRIDVHCERLNKYIGVFYEEIESVKHVIGYSMSLSCVSKIRGFDASECKRIIFDEFIEEAHCKKLKSSGLALLNAYETINRNRELKGEKPCELWLLSNANTVDSDILLELNILPLHDKIKKSIAFDDNILLIEPEASPISFKKSQTGIYKLSKSFNKMSLDNQFVGHYEGNIKSMSLNNSALWIIYNDLSFYTFRDNNLVYVTQYRRKNERPIYTYGDSDFEKKKFKAECSSIFNMYLAGMMYFENTKCEALFNRIWEA